MTRAKIKSRGLTALEEQRLSMLEAHIGHAVWLMEQLEGVYLPGDYRWRLGQEMCRMVADDPGWKASRGYSAP